MRFPVHLWIGLVVLTLSQVAMLRQIEPFWSWHTPIAWTAYILIVDAVIYSKRGSSWLMTNRREFAFLAAVSIPLWVVFEGYNLLIRNWFYVNLPENPLVRYFGYAWAFATISPGIFQTAELVSVLRHPRMRFPIEGPNARGTLVAGESRPISENDGRMSNVDRALVATGAAMLLWPI